MEQEHRGNQLGDCQDGHAPEERNAGRCGPETARNEDNMSNETNATIDEIMSDIQSFASSWALTGGRFDDGSMAGIAEEQRGAVRRAITAALDSQARQIEALTAERDELRKRLDDAKPATPAPGEWVEWNGGECPIADGVLFSAKFRDGTITNKYRHATEYRWSHGGGDLGVPEADIVAYRILPLPLIARMMPA
jgi:hypothetical protein